MSAPHDLLTGAEVAVTFRVRRNAVSRWAREGKLTPVLTPGGRPRFLRGEVDGLLRGIPLTAEQVEALRATLGSAS